MQKPIKKLVMVMAIATATRYVTCSKKYNEWLIKEGNQTRTKLSVFITIRLIRINKIPDEIKAQLLPDKTIYDDNHSSIDNKKCKQLDSSKNHAE